MGDVEALTELLSRLLRSNEDGKEAADQRQQELIAQLVAARPDAAALRAEKVAKLGAALRKSTKIKEFKEGGECSIKEWLRRWEHEVESLKKMCGINDALTREEVLRSSRTGWTTQSSRDWIQPSLLKTQYGLGQR